MMPAVPECRDEIYILEGTMQCMLGQPEGEGTKVLLDTPKGCQASKEVSRLSGAGEKAEAVKKRKGTPKVQGCPPISNLQLFFQRQGEAPGNDTETLEAAMAPCIDSMLKAQHLASERSRPSSDKVVAALSSTNRAQIIAWIMKSFLALGLEDTLAHSVVLTIDRYCASQDCAVPSSLLQCLILSAACAEFKMHGFSDWPEFSWKRILEHMTQGQVPMLKVLRFELDLLTRLQFVVGLPTPLTFMRNLATRMRVEEQVTQWLGLATFLLDLALLDLELQHAYAYAYLAAGALMAALRVFSAPAKQREAILEDVDACWPAEGPETSEEIVATCELHLLQLWIRGQEGMLEHDCYPMLERKFRYQSKIQVTVLTPQEALAALRDERKTRDKRKTLDMDSAVLASRACTSHAGSIRHQMAAADLISYTQG
eukprot:TRINITY_DN9708_c0_g2_i2.p1 TRINITY_DN9708_c0_g2~~TRINITY_DN9708_c0_g2_i2.p1  ORF type:complete len:427 (+),score=98.69 TRINITY_DN9708_c0_g2_i2:39-1319(+)